MIALLCVAAIAFLILSLLLVAVCRSARGGPLPPP